MLWYDFKLHSETLWMVAVAVFTVIFQAVAVLDVAALADWRTWLLGVAVACIRAAGAAALVALGRGRIAKRPSQAVDSYPWHEGG